MLNNINKITELLPIKLLEKTPKYGLTPKDVYLIATAPALHDIGKVEINGAILNKTGKLTAEEFDEVKKHTVLGAQMISNVHEYRDEPPVKTRIRYVFITTKNTTERATRKDLKATKYRSPRRSYRWQTFTTLLPQNAYTKSRILQSRR